MKNKVKRNRNIAILFSVLYVICAVCLFWFHPFVASAAETDTTTKKVPGGVGNTVVFNSVVTYEKGKYKNTYSATLKAGSDYEIVGVISEMGNIEDGGYYQVYFRVIGKDGKIAFLSKNNLSDCVGVEMNYTKDVLQRSFAYSMDSIVSSVMYKSPNDNQTITCFISGCKIFTDSDSMNSYAETGSLEGMLTNDIDKTWYLKGVHFFRESGSDAVPEQYRDNVAVYFTWLTDNLQDGDLLEVRTHNYLKKPLGEKISGFHDYITWADNVSAYTGKFRFLQYDPAKAWVDSLENKPFFINSYDTDIYYLRPYRNGKTGIWCKVVIGRDSAGRPYAEDISYGDLDDEGDWEEDEDVTDKEGGHHGIDVDDNITYPDDENPFDGDGITGIFKTFFDFMKNIPSLLGDLPELVKTIVGFLPDWLIGLIGIAVIIVIILRIVGR